MLLNVVDACHRSASFAVHPRLAPCRSRGAPSPDRAPERRQWLLSSRQCQTRRSKSSRTRSRCVSTYLDNGFGTSSARLAVLRLWLWMHGASPLTSTFACVLPTAHQCRRHRLPRVHIGPEAHRSGVPQCRVQPAQVSIVRGNTGYRPLGPYNLPAMLYVNCAFRFPAVIMHLKEPKSAALIFASGKMVVTGESRTRDPIQPKTFVYRESDILPSACRRPK